MGSPRALLAPTGAGQHPWPVPRVGAPETQSRQAWGLGHTSRNTHHIWGTRTPRNQQKTVSPVTNTVTCWTLNLSPASPTAESALRDTPLNLTTTQTQS